MSTARYLTNISEPTMLPKINRNVFVKPQKRYMTIILCSLHTTPTQALTVTHTGTLMRRRSVTDIVVILFVQMSFNAVLKAREH